MRSLRKDTLAYQLGMRPAFQALDTTKARLKEVVFALNAFMKQDNAYALLSQATMHEAVCGSSEVDALMFYMLNHAVSIVRTKRHPLEPLGEYLPILELHAREMAVRSSRMFFYLLLICTRESRHNKNSPELYGMLQGKCPKAVFDFHKGLPYDSTGAQMALRQGAPDVRLGEYTQFLEDVFFKGKYGGGYGGKAWGEIAKVLNQYVHGKLTAELMLDTAYTLAHNNGPIFNKGMLYEQYSQEIYHILDVQRSGQIPQLVAQSPLKHTKNFHVQTVWKRCRSILGTEFDGYVDYFKVEQLGALKSYKTQQAEQVKLYGAPEGYKDVSSIPNSTAGQHQPFGNKVSKAQIFGLEEKPEDLDKPFPADAVLVEIFPKEFVQKVKVRP